MADGRHQIGAVRFLRTLRNRHVEIVRRHFFASFPIPDVDCVLRRPLDLGASDDIAAGLRAVALGDPNLPIHLVGSESEMVTFDPADYPAPKVFRIHN